MLLMKKPYFPVLFLMLIINNLQGQTKMKTITELINKEEDAITLVKSWAEAAQNKVELLKPTIERAQTALYDTQVSTRSPMGAIIYHTGGILINDGWVRIYGSGSERLNRNLPEWNKGKSFQEAGEQPSFLLIADDAVGGFFLLNGSALGDDLGNVYYAAPDNLQAEPLDLNYSEFIQVFFSADLEDFYQGLRWNGWAKDLESLSTNEAFTFYPFLWTEEGADINKVNKGKVSLEEAYQLRMKFLAK